jgi:hypothetical protein
VWSTHKANKIIDLLYHSVPDVLSYILIFICLGRQTKQIMVAKFQTLMCLLAKTESSPNSSKRLLPFICTLTPQNEGEITASNHRRINLFSSLLVKEKIVPDWSMLSNIALFFIDIHAYIKLHDN